MEDELYVFKETGTAISTKNISYSLKEANIIEPFLSKIRTLSKSKVRIFYHQNKTCTVKLKGQQMDVELAHHFLNVAISKSPQKDYIKLTGDDSINSINEEEFVHNLLSSDDLVQTEQPQNVEEKLQELYAREKILKGRMKKHVINKQILEALHSSGPLETEFWIKCQIPYQRIMPKNREKAITAITAVVTEPLLKKASRKLLTFRKILDFFKSFHESAESIQQSKYFLNYFQLLSKLVFRQKSKESSAVFQQLKRGLYQLKKSERPILASKTYTKLTDLYHQIANPNPNDIPKMLDIAQCRAKHLQKRLDKSVHLRQKSIKGRKNSKSKHLK